VTALSRPIAGLLSLVSAIAGAAGIAITVGNYDDQLRAAPIGAITHECPELPMPK
jgi:hypothetical protein